MPSSRATTHSFWILLLLTSLYNCFESHLKTALSYYVLLWKLQTKRLEGAGSVWRWNWDGGVLRLPLAWDGRSCEWQSPSEWLSGHLWAGPVCLDGKCVCMCPSPSGQGENRPAFQSRPSPPSENSHPADTQTSSLLLLPAQSYQLALGEDLSVHKARSHNHIWLSKQSRETGTTGRTPRQRGLCDVPNWRTTITEAIIIINKKNDSSNGHLSGRTLWGREVDLQMKNAGSISLMQKPRLKKAKFPTQVHTAT